MMPLRVSMLATLIEQNVLGLGLGDAQFGLELVGPGDAGQVGARRQALALLDRHLLEHPGDAGAHRQLLELALAQLEHRPLLLHLGPLGGELGVDRFGDLGETLLLDLELLRGLLGGERRAAMLDLRSDAVLVEAPPGFGVDVRRPLGRVGRRHVGLLIEQLTRKLGLEIGVVRLGPLQGQLGVSHGLLELRVREQEDHRVGLDLGAGAEYDLLHPRVGLRRDPADLLRHQGARAADRAQELASLDLLDPHRSSVDLAGRRLEAENPPGHEGQGYDGQSAHDDAAALLLLLVFR